MGEGIRASIRAEEERQHMSYTDAGGAGGTGGMEKMAPRLGGHLGDMLGGSCGNATAVQG